MVGGLFGQDSKPADQATDGISDVVVDAEKSAREELDRRIEEATRKHQTEERAVRESEAALAAVIAKLMRVRSSASVFKIK